MNIREFAESVGFEIIGKLKYIKKEKDGTRVYYDKAGNEFYQSKTGICIIDADGGVI